MQKPLAQVTLLDLQNFSDSLARDDGHRRNQRRDITLIAQAFARYVNQRLSSFYDYTKADDFLDYNLIDATDRQKVQPYAKARCRHPTPMPSLKLSAMRAC